MKNNIYAYHGLAEAIRVQLIKASNRTIKPKERGCIGKIILRLQYTHRVDSKNKVITVKILLLSYADLFRPFCLEGNCT